MWCKATCMGCLPSFEITEVEHPRMTAADSLGMTKAANS